MSLIRIEDVDVVFSKSPKPALDLLDQGLSRDAIFKQTGLIVSVEKANLTVQRGEICVLMGLSGSGKSSLLRCINGLNTVSRGRLLIEHEGADVDIAQCSAATLKAMRTKRIAMVFQKFALMPWLSVAENVSLGLEMQGLASAERKKRIDDKLELVGLSQWRDKRPDALSGGMQQRVGLARALASNAEIMLMDEAFSALDPLIRTEMQNLLVELQNELHKTIVFITHDLDEALKLADHLVILKDGEIVQQGEPQGIVMQPADGYVTDFVGDINRARVLRVRSVMTPTDAPADGAAGEIDCDATLEQMIALTGGDTSQNYIVTRDGDPVGELDMKDLVKALAPETGTTGTNTAASP